MATTSATGAYDQVRYNFDTEPGAQYEVSLWARRGQGETQMLTQWEGTESFEVQRIDSSEWKNYRQIVTATGSEITLKAYVSVQGQAGDSLYLDGLSIVKISPASLDNLVEKSALKVEQNQDGDTATVRFEMPEAHEINRPHYTLQRSPDLSTWFDMSLNFTQVGSSASATIPLNSSSFYRLKLTSTD